MFVFLLIALGSPVLYVGLIRAFTYAFASTKEPDSRAASRLRWLHWLVTGSALFCLVLVMGELGLHYPLFTVVWLLAGGVLAGGRSRLHQLLPEERSLAKAQVWILGVLSPFLVVGALIASDDVVFQSATASVEVDRSFALEASEEYGQIRFYQTTYFLFHEQVGELRQNKTGSIASMDTMFNRAWWAEVQAVGLDPVNREAHVYFAGPSEKSVLIRME
ncbi:MAG: hypothetical protein EOO60_10575 [Hymenobacter sp.]|nr:MAG: hypothetical protein EOO60_10575 [Hymenobacter sp.]